VYRHAIDTYDYADDIGNQIVRFEPKESGQRHPGRGGEWISEKGPLQVLYHLREVKQAPIVFIVEGEKDTGTLRSRGFLPTTNAGGANAPWLPAYIEALRGREVILIPDNDPPGKARVVRIARALFGSVARLIILELEDGRDVTD
jgi:putative DNA primase/helicase